MKIGHIVAGPCPNQGAHRTTIIDGSHACIACEVEAWEAARRLAPFSAAMHARMARALDTYRKTIAAPLDAIRRMDQISSRRGFHEERLRRLRWEIIQERQRRVMAELASAGWRTR